MGQDAGGTRDVHRRVERRAETVPFDAERVAVPRTGPGLRLGPAQPASATPSARAGPAHDAPAGARLRAFVLHEQTTTVTDTTRTAAPARPDASARPRYGAARIEGLPADLPEPARAYLDALPPGRIVGFPLAPLDRTGVPAWKTALFLDDAVSPAQHAVRLRLRRDGRRGDRRRAGRDRREPDADARRDAAQDGARLATTTSSRARRRRGRRSADALPAGRQPGRARHAARLDGGDPRARPARRCWCRSTSRRRLFELPPGYEPFTTLITNGLGAGPDVEWAVGHGLLECCSATATASCSARSTRASCSTSRRALAPETRACSTGWTRLGIEVLPKFATDEFGLANLYVVGYDRNGHGPPRADHAVGLRRGLRSRTATGRSARRCSNSARPACARPTATARSRSPSGAPPGYVDAFIDKAAAEPRPARRAGRSGP